MISFRHDRPPSPPSSNHPSNSSLDTFQTASSSSPVSPPAQIHTPVPLRPTSSAYAQDHPAPLAGYSVPSPPPLDPNDSCPRIFQDTEEFVPPPMTELPLDISLDDENLSAVERIYLLCRSKATIHRVFISRSLHTFLPDVSPLEGVEYVLPLLNGLAVDDEDAVKEALVTNLVAIMWWFFENCQLTETEPPDEQQNPPLLPVQTFTPILGSLLIDQNAVVGGPARFAVVEILNRLHSARDKGEDLPPFGKKEREMFEQEVIQQVIIGMGRLDLSEENSLSPISMTEAEAIPSISPTVLPSLLAEPADDILHLLERVSTSDTPLGKSSTMENDSSQLAQEPLTPSFLAPSLIPPADTLGSSLDLQGSLRSTSSSQESEILSSSASVSRAEDTLEVRLRPIPPSGSEASGDSTLNQRHGIEAGPFLMTDIRNPADIQEDVNEQAAIGRLSSMSLIATVTAHVNLPEDTIRAFADEVAYIGADSLYWVRREASFALGALAKVVPTEVLMLSLLPLFEALVQDTVWHVRHSAVFALPGIITRLSPQHRRTLALQTLRRLASDLVPNVRSGVLEVLGEVIYTFHNDDEGVPADVVKMFIVQELELGSEQLWRGDSNQVGDYFEQRRERETTITSASALQTDDDPSPEDETTHQDPGIRALSPGILRPLEEFPLDPARPLITSFNYPAVALSLGPGRWDEVRRYYLALARDKNVRVRRTIAAGLGEIAKILGSEHTKRDLLEVWQDMVHDSEDAQTRLKALGGLHLFVEVLQGPDQESVVVGLIELWERWLSEWRERECLTEQLPVLAVLVEGQGDIVRILVGKALVDNVAAVREAAIGVLPRIFSAFTSRPQFSEALRDDLHALACADLCRRRTTYISCCRALIESSDGQIEVGRKEFWDRMVNLGHDDVVDVRIGMARLLCVVCDKFYPTHSSRPPRVMDIIRRLRFDLSRDVRAFAAYLLAASDSAEPRTTSFIPYPKSPGMFATFSCPPPAYLPMEIDMGKEENIDISDETMKLTVDEVQVQGSTIVKLERVDDLGNNHVLTQERRESDAPMIDDPFEPPPVERPRSD